MNLHPILVHFPIALLTLYSVLEILQIKAVLNRAYVFYIKAVLVILGALGGVAAALAGLAIKSRYITSPTLGHTVAVHEWFALISIVYFGLLAVCYLAAWIDREWTNAPQGLRPLLKPLRAIIETRAIALAGLVGLALITITGALGGALAYGPNTDPAASFVYHLFVK